MAPNTMTPEERIALLEEENARLKQSNEEWKETRKSQVVFANGGPDDLLRAKTLRTTGVFVTHEQRAASRKAREKRNRIMRSIMDQQAQGAMAALSAQAAAAMVPAAAPVVPVAPPAAPVAPVAPAAPPQARRGRKPKAILPPVVTPVAPPESPADLGEGPAAMEDGDVPPM